MKESIVLFGSVNGTIERLYTARQAAALLGIDRNYFYRRVGSRHISGVRIDRGCQLFPQSELQAYSNKYQKKST